MTTRLSYMSSLSTLRGGGWQENRSNQQNMPLFDPQQFFKPRL